MSKMTKDEIISFLKEHNICFDEVKHKAVYNMEEVLDVDIPNYKCIAKNVFVRDDKKNNYYLISINGKKRVDLKNFRKEYNTRSLSMASIEELKSILKLTPGEVTPFGLLNDEYAIVHFFIDEYFFKEGKIGVHPNENTTTIFMNTEDLIKIIKNHGNEVTILYEN